MADYSAIFRTSRVQARTSKASERQPGPFVGWQLAIVETLTVIALLVACQAVYTTVIWGAPDDLNMAAGVGLILAALYGLIAHARQLYSAARVLAVRNSLPDVAGAWIMACLIAAMSAFLLKMGDQVSRGAAMSALFGGFFALSAARTVTASALRSGLALGTVKRLRAFVMIDGASGADELLEILARQGYRVIRCVSFNGQIAEDASRFIDQIQELVRERQVDEVFVVTSFQNVDRLEQLGPYLRRLPIAVHFVAPPEIQRLLDKPIVDCGRFRTIELQRPALRTHERAIKRAVDIAGATVAITFLWPVLLLIAIAIKLDSPGPVIFVQDRMGWNGRSFRIYKFRSMRTLDNGPVVQQAQRGDRRVTAVGRWIRSTSLDELPQFFNVFFGDMSLVGPRPHVLTHDSQYSALISDYALRHHIKPGITGLAQVVGFRGETATPDLMERRVECDLWYIANWSLWLDVRILFRTAFVVTNVAKVY